MMGGFLNHLWTGYLTRVLMFKPQARSKIASLTF